MIVDYLGSQATPYYMLDYKSYWRSRLDSLTTVIKSPEMKSDYWYAYNNTSPSISANESWVKEQQPSAQGNHYERGSLGIRLASFPTINSEFEPGKISSYSQRVVLATNQCITTFVYNNKINVKVTSFASWKANRVIVYGVEMTNISDDEVRVGFVADPIVAFQGEKMEFRNLGRQLSLTLPANDNALFYDHFISLGALKGNKILAPNSNNRIVDSTILKPKQKIDYSAYLAIYCGTDENINETSAISSIAAMQSKGFENAGREHQKEVKAFWDKFYVLLPWKDLCKVYYRNILITVGNMRFGKYNSQVSMMTNSSYKGLSYGMDNMPSIELLLQLGRTDYLKNFVESIGESLPADETNQGHTLNYNYNQFPWRTSILCNTSGNTIWMLYEYYRLTGDVRFLKESLYPMMRSICNFYTGYAEEINGVYGFWTRKKYQDRVWTILSYDEKVFMNGKAIYSWGEIDHPTDVVGPAKLALEVTIKTAEELNVDSDLLKKWKNCYSRLQIPQNNNFYQHYTDRPDGKGLGTDIFPFRHIMACAVYNLVYPTPVVVNDKKMEDTYLILRDTTKSKFEWFFNYNQQLWGAVARLRLSNEMEWLMTKSEMRLDKTFHKDGMMIGEHQHGGAAGYFFMPYAMIAASVNEMLLQSYDGVIKVFPATFPGFDNFPISFKGLHALDGFVVSASRNRGKAEMIEITSKLGRPCYLEIPSGWSSANVSRKNSSKNVLTTEEIKSVRKEGKDSKIKVVCFDTQKDAEYIVTSN
jgi:hypothetical protein